MMDANKWTGRKIILVVVYAILVIVNRKFELGLDLADLCVILGAVGGFLGVEGVRDWIATRNANIKPKRK